jgi:hypothetical protein
LPTLHGNTTCTEPRITLPRARCQSGTSAGRWSCRADRAVGGWSRPSNLHASAVSHGALAAEVPQGLKPDRNTAFNAALKRYSTQLKHLPKNQNPPAIRRDSILLCPVWAGQPRGKLPAAPSPYLRQSPILPVGPATRDDPWWAAAYAR